MSQAAAMTAGRATGGKAKAEDARKLPKDVGDTLTKAGMGLAVVGVLAAGAGYAMDAKRFAASYLIGFLFVATIALGGLFFVLVQHLARAGWSVAARRQMEWLASLLPAVAVLSIPIFVWAHDLYHHWMGPQAATDPLLQKKAGYLNPSFFYGRSAFYVIVWVALGLYFTRKSSAQDESGDAKLTEKMQAASAPAMILFALTTTFAAFDWVMSLDPHWYSTIFGVYVFAGCATSSLSVLALITVQLQQRGYFKKVSTIEHRHDIGKLLFGFIVFFAYIGFSQFLLIWYADIPEETVWYHHRWDDAGWAKVSLAIFFGHFLIPFLLLLSRHAKRNALGLSVGAVIMLVMHYVDLYWLVMPTFDHHFHFSVVDICGLLGPLGIAAFLVARKAAQGPLYPLRDPRLAETVKVDNP
ncbi:hypothetical protein [Polyangium sp. 6x1]|uniref:hypothetical protein n=1 Tax=Polyangium sp. 6x1 TaxID=3042689 RepID=UPI002482C85B|nr:hypothetical protein [Polyangium sp. 6x1]MDI1445563.1 hypothetical protein [Polyangium sp. 6x1]